MTTQFDKELDDALWSINPEEVDSTVDKAKEAIKKAVEVHIIGADYKKGGSPFTNDKQFTHSRKTTYGKEMTGREGAFIINREHRDQRKRLYGEDK